jgi:two-component system cell cycle response regulator DivK
MTEQPAGLPLVLVVEDDADARELYELMLRSSGFRVESASNGADAVAKARSLRPRLILMDLTLPAISGWEASRQLKQDAGTRDIPIVALSGNPVGEGTVFADALLKPCFPDDLVARVRRLLEIQ